MKKIFCAIIVLFSLAFISACPYSTNKYDNAISVDYDQDFVEIHYDRADYLHDGARDNYYSYDYVYEARTYNSRSSRVTDQQNLPLIYYGSDRGFVSDSRYLNQGTPSNIHSGNYYYKYTPYFGGYYEAYKCYDNPPKNKLFYIKCP